MDFMQYISNDGLVLIPAIWIICRMFKAWKGFPDELIPVIALCFGVAGAMTMLGATPSSFIQGIFIGWAAVGAVSGVNQIQKLAKSDN